MNIENVRKWIAALRSRQYKQTTYCLYEYNNKSCALGVAGRCLFNANENNYISACTIESALEIDGKLCHDIIMLNDYRGLKFYEIARYLERKLNAYIRNQSTVVCPGKTFRTIS